MSWKNNVLRRLKNNSQNDPIKISGHNNRNRKKRRVIITGDNPIRQSKDDTLGRAGAAKSFAKQVISLDAREGVVVGVLGAWGSGKTSFINLALPEFKRIGVPILNFNPWMFSGAEQLVESFFTELAAQLRVRPGFKEIADDIEEYAEVFSVLKQLPVVGPWIESIGGVSKILRKSIEGRKKGIGGRRDKLEIALAELNHQVVVILDDIDRLSSSEIREIFKLVRLTASFPNIVYIVAFDRFRVENALSYEGILGRDYLEKILQVAVDLPAVAPEILNRQLLTAIDSVLSRIDNPGPFDSLVWPDIFLEIVRPLVRNMRDIRRYAAAIYGTVKALDGQIALTDVLALEAIRTFLPDVFGRVHGAIEALTTTSDLSFGTHSDSPHLKASIDTLIKIGGEHQELVWSMIKRLFPAAERHIGGSNYERNWKKQWLRERRVAHEDILRLYFERVAGKGYQAFTDAERAFSVMADHDEFDSYLRSLDIEHLEDVIASLENFEDKFAAEHVVPGTIVLLTLLPYLPERPRGIVDIDTRHVVSRVFNRLLRSLGDPNKVETAVRTILPELTSLSSKLELITNVGYREGAGHQLVSEGAATEFELSWRSEVRAASSSDLEHEIYLLRVLRVAKKYATGDESALEIPTTPELVLKILRAAWGEIKSQSMGNRAIRRSPRLDWDTLIELFDGEDKLREQIEKIKEIKPRGEDELLSLVDKYLSGWRPKDFDDD